MKKYYIPEVAKTAKALFTACKPYPHQNPL